MGCTEALMTLFLLAPCDGGSGDALDLDVANALASPDRMEADRKNDALRRPDQVLEFFDIRPGMTVLDLFSGGGYYTEIVSRVVGPGGRVLAHNNQAYLAFARESLEGRFNDGRLANVDRLTSEADQLDLPDNHFDAALAMLTWHDFYYLDEENGWPAIDERGMVEKLCAALKPGGVLGVTDHVAAAGSDPESSAQNLHRIDPAQIRKDLEAGCFTFEGEINVLRNPADDHLKPMFDPSIRGRTDRVVYRFRKKA
jgi:predicted methyltransferase